MKEEPGVTPMEEGGDVCEGVKAGDKRSETERKNATKEEIDEVRRPSVDLDSVLPCLCLFVVRRLVPFMEDVGISYWPCFLCTHSSSS